MFDGPEYASYIALCRELRLERNPFQIGDWLWDGWSKEPHCQISFVKLNAPPSRDVFWLPRLDQWLAMLEEAGEDSLTIHRDGPGQYAIGESITWEHRVTGPTREEAAARLWIAVTKVEVAKP